MTDSSTLPCFELNFDGLVGPTHNYAGLSPGNIASAENRNTPSNPRKAVKQGLEKMKFLLRLGIPQALLPPLARPSLNVLRDLGFAGSPERVLRKAGAEVDAGLNEAFEFLARQLIQQEGQDDWRREAEDDIQDVDGQRIPQ